MKNPTHAEKVVRKALVFERALHCWDRWLDSIEKGPKILTTQGTRPSLEEMKDVASRMLTELGFSACRVFELYWLCCVFSDYRTAHGFKFEMLVLPDWFPYPSEFKWEKFGFDSYWKNLDFRNKRIIPPDIWDETDRKFWFSKSLMGRYLSPENRIKCFQEFPNRDFILILPDDHPVRNNIKKGRPIITKADGETLLD